MASAVKETTQWHSTTLPPLKGRSILPEDHAQPNLWRPFSHTHFQFISKLCWLLSSHSLPWPRAANTARSRGGTWETDFQSLSLSLNSCEPQGCKPSGYSDADGTTLGRSDRGIETKRCPRIPRAPAPCVWVFAAQASGLWVNEPQLLPVLGLQVSPNVLGLQVSTLIQNEAEMSCPHQTLSSLQIFEQNSCVHCFKLLNFKINLLCCPSNTNTKWRQSFQKKQVLPHVKGCWRQNKMMAEGDFPGGPVAETPCSQCKGPGFDPPSGN